MKKNVFKCVLIISCIQNKKKALVNGELFQINICYIKYSVAHVQKFTHF